MWGRNTNHGGFTKGRLQSYAVKTRSHIWARISTPAIPWAVRSIVWCITQSGVSMWVQRWLGRVDPISAPGVKDCCGANVVGMQLLLLIFCCVCFRLRHSIGRETERLLLLSKNSTGVVHLPFCWFAWLWGALWVWLAGLLLNSHSLGFGGGENRFPQFKQSSVYWAKGFIHNNTFRRGA